MNYIALIPSYEPSNVLLDLARELYKDGFITVIVDDGSGDEFDEMFNSLSKFAKVIRYSFNQGKGHALKTGLAYIYENYEDVVVVTMDADGQHTVADAKVLCEEAEGQTNAFFLGSRRLPKDAPFKSRWGNSITRKVYKAATGLAVYDTQSGLRAFSSRFIPQFLRIDGDRYEYEMNVLLYLARHKIFIREIPIEVIYFDKQNSVSHFNPLTDSIKIYKQILKFTGSSFISFLIDYGIYSLLEVAIGGASFGLIAANLIARFFSSIFNFTMNKKMVFRSKGDLKKEAIKYFSLVIAIIAVNTAILSLLTNLGMNPFVGKLIVECLMFFVSYFVQNRFIFKGKTDKSYPRKEEKWERNMSLQ